MPVCLGAYARFEPVMKDKTLLRSLAQFGVDKVIVGCIDPSLNPGGKTGGSKPGLRWDYLRLVNLVNEIRDLGMELGTLELAGQAEASAMEHIWLGGELRDRQIDNLAHNIRLAGKAGVTLMAYHWMVNPPTMISASWRHSYEARGRGGALLSRIDMDRLEPLPLFRGREYSREEMWDNYEYFARRIVPVCEEAGVRMAVHPDDPPVASMGGVPRLFHDLEGHLRALEIGGSEMWGINMCLGNWQAMGIDLDHAIRSLGGERIFMGHVQAVNGTVPSFGETFLDLGDCDLLAVIRSLNRAGSGAHLAPAHWPRVDGDGDFRQTNAFDLGYMRALIKTAEREPQAPEPDPPASG